MNPSSIEIESLKLNLLVLSKIVYAFIDRSEMTYNARHSICRRYDKK